MADKSKRLTTLISFLLGAGLMAFAIVLVNHYRPSPNNPLLASIGPYRFTQKNIGKTAKYQMALYDAQAYHVLKGEADDWIEAIIFDKESKLQKLNLNDYLLQEVFSQVSVSDSDVYEVYASSPIANLKPYRETLDDIKQVLTVNRQKKAKADLIESLSSKYSIRYYLDIPPGDAPTPLDVHKVFGTYETKPAEAFWVNGKAVASPYRGAKDAKLVLEVYSDFNCPHSKRFSKILNQFLAAHPQARVEYHHYPLGPTLGWRKSQASTCAQEQGKFWEYHDGLFSKNITSDEGLLQLAKDLKLDQSKFSSCLSSAEYAEFVKFDRAEGASRGVKETPHFFLNGRSHEGAGSFQKLKTISDWILSPRGPYPKGPKSGSPSSAPPITQIIDEQDLKGSPALGPMNAKITIVEFIDFHCPYCKRGNDNLAEALKKHKADVRLVSKHFPLSNIHPDAQQAAMASLCAHAQGQYWPFRDALFKDSARSTSLSGLKEIASELGLNQDFDICLENKKTLDAVKEDRVLAYKWGVGGTPAYFINGKLLSGARPVSDFERSIQEELE
jgi:protein-disulfide isomerase